VTTVLQATVNRERVLGRVAPFRHSDSLEDGFRRFLIALVPTLAKTTHMNSIPRKSEVLEISREIHGPKKYEIPGEKNLLGNLRS